MQSIKEFIKKFPLRRSDPPTLRTFGVLFFFLCYISVAIFLGWKLYKLHKDERTLTYQKEYKATIPPPSKRHFCKRFKPYFELILIIIIVSSRLFSF